MTTQELPKKHHEAGVWTTDHWLLTTDALWQIDSDTLDILKIWNRFRCAKEQHKGQNGEISNVFSR